jgi:hypothetical protein
MRGISHASGRDRHFDAPVSLLPADSRLTLADVAFDELFESRLKNLLCLALAAHLLAVDFERGRCDEDIVGLLYVGW